MHPCSIFLPSSHTLSLSFDYDEFDRDEFDYDEFDHDEFDYDEFKPRVAVRRGRIGRIGRRNDMSSTS